MAATICVLAACDVMAVPGRRVGFDRIVLDATFRAEGVAVADVNMDGRRDVLAGELWYEAPSWTPHEIRPPGSYDPASGYSNCFLSWADDLNGDGWPDQIVVGFPGAAPVWRENPRGAAGPWPEHRITGTAGNESPAFAELLNDERLTLVAGNQDAALVWYEPQRSPADEFIAHPISSPGSDCGQQFAHGLGIGDVTGDGRADVVCASGIYVAPEDPRTGPWPFIALDLGSVAAQMAVVDVNGDRRPDIVTSSPHGIGVWWWEQRRRRQFVRHDIDDTFSQSHALAVADLNGDRRPDIVTGKRFWAHGPTGDVRPDDPAVLYWFELRRRGRRVRWIRHTIDSDSGVGTQVVIDDVDGDRLPDVVVANKKGVFVFRQTR